MVQVKILSLTLSAQVFCSDKQPESVSFSFPNSTCYLKFMQVDVHCECCQRWCDSTGSRDYEVFYSMSTDLYSPENAWGTSVPEGIVDNDDEFPCLPPSTDDEDEEIHDIGTNSF